MFSRGGCEPIRSGFATAHQLMDRYPGQESEKNSNVTAFIAKGGKREGHGMDRQIHHSVHPPPLRPFDDKDGVLWRVGGTSSGCRHWLLFLN